MAWERASASDQPARPGAPAMGTPPRTNCRVGSKAWTSKPIPTRISAGLLRHGRRRRGQERLAQLDVAGAGDLHVAGTAGDGPRTLRMRFPQVLIYENDGRIAELLRRAAPLLSAAGAHGKKWRQRRAISSQARAMLT